MSGQRSGIPKGIIFDLDGTLYCCRTLVLRMIPAILARLLLAPTSLSPMVMAHRFTKLRERLAHAPEADVENAQYRLCAEFVGVRPETVRQAVREWLCERPLPFLRQAMFPELPELLALLKRRNIKTGVFSDFEPGDKLDAMGVRFDAVVWATDRAVDRLKPHPAGLLLTAEKLGLSVRECLFIGDTDDKDGECARRARMDYLLLSPLGRPSPGRITSYRELIDRLQASA